MHVEFHPAALQEAEDAQSWYAERSVLAASAFTRELSLAVQRVAEAPSRYPAAEARTRKALLDRFPFTLYYRVTPEVVSVVAVAHQALGHVLPFGPVFRRLIEPLSVNPER